MAQNYTRQSSFADGDTITASLFNNEFNQVVNAFSYSASSDSSTGHKHDGTAGQGGNIPKIGDIDFLNKIVVDSTNNRWGIFVEVAGGPVEQVRIQDGGIVPVTTNDIDLGTASLQFKDIFIDGTANIDSLVLSSGSTVTAILDEDDLVSDSATALATQQSIKAYVDAQVTAQDLDIVGDTGTDAIDLDSETLTFTGGTGITSVVTAGTVTHNIDSTVATLTGTQTLTNKTITSPDIDGGTVDGADITVGAAKTLDVSAGTLTLADNQISGDKVEGGTIAAITITAMTGTLQTAAQPNVTSLGTIASLVATTADINGGTIDGAVIGGTTPAALSATTGTFSSTLGVTGAATFSSTVAGAFNGTLGATTPASVAATTGTFSGDISVAGIGTIKQIDSNSVMIGSGAVNLRMIDVTSDIRPVDSAGLGVDGTVDLGDANARFKDLYLSGAVNAGAATFGGVITANAGVVVDNFTLDGTTLALSSGNFTVDVAGNIILDADSGEIEFKDGGTTFGNIAKSGNDLRINQSIQDGDIVFRGNDGGSIITVLTLDLSEAGAATFNSNVTGVAFIASAGLYTNNGIIYGNEAGINLKDSGSRSIATFNDTGLGTSNVAMGVNAGNSITSGGNYNVVVGDEAGTAITTGDENVAVGFNSLAAIDTGIHNVSVGSRALQADVKGNYSTAIGKNALTAQSFASATDAYNTAVGYAAGAAVTTGTQNTLIGGIAGDALDTSNYNTAVGYSALSSDTLGERSTALGHEALASQNFTSSTVTGNTALGFQAGRLVSTGTFNTIVGHEAGTVLTTGVQNTLIGGLAGDAITTASYNTAVGYGALTTATVGYGTAVGFRAGLSTTTGIQNVFIGSDAGGLNTTGTRNTFVGPDAGYYVTTGSANTIIGKFNGNQGGLDIRTASNHIVLSDGDGNPRGVFDASGNLGLGIVPSAWSGMRAMDIGDGSFAISSDGAGAGDGSLTWNGYYNGSNWIYKYTGGGANRFRLNESGAAWFTAPSGTAGNPITFTQAMTLDASGVLSTTTTIADWAVKHDNASATTPYGIRMYYTAATPNSTGSTFLQCVDSTADRLTIRSNGGIANYQANDANLSDRREKANFSPSKSYLETICAIPVQTFNYIDQNMEDDPGLTLGVVAQDVQAVAPEFVMESNWGTEEDPKMRLSLYQTDLQYALMKCIQEQQAIIESLTARIEALEGAN